MMYVPPPLSVPIRSENYPTPPAPPFPTPKPRPGAVNSGNHTTHNENPPAFSLNALIRTSKPYHDIWLENEYGISEGIAMNEFGEFRAEAVKFLRLQAELRHPSGTHEGRMRVFGKKIEEGKLKGGIRPVISKVGMGFVLRGQGEVTVKRSPPAGSLDRMGILNGGVKIGKEEDAQLLCYKRRVTDTRNVSIKTVLRPRSYGTALRLLRFNTFPPSANVVRRVDRAIYNN
ncbi:unnamed protein product [Tuber melanosporum]|uniref:(Perigord truffle) hypothetical protein n=1 Tax=Tuber melanosporum (strain Mel28) TaxID=656061 RepID=D5GNR7_TUBMM|nr:uncharacterized protein GSTUM_00011444001 [Tuber melanosporum]CAZ86164.1 unnamed protein product [Tuber melanosporum]